MEPTQNHVAMQSGSAVEFDGATSFSYSTLCSTSGFTAVSTDGIVSSPLHSISEAAITDIPNVNLSINVPDLLNTVTAAGATHLTPQNIVMAAGGSSTSNYNTSSLGGTTFTAGSSQPIFFSGLDGGHSTIITFHTMPLVDSTSGQDLTVITDGNVSQASSSAAATVDLSSPENASLLQSLLSQGIMLKSDDASLLTSEKSMGQFIDFIPSSVPSGHVVQEVASQLPSSSSLAGDVSVLLETRGECGAASSLAANSSDSEGAASFEFTDETPIFTRVCATLNADILHSIIGRKDLSLDQLWGEDSVQLSIDGQQGLTMEASFLTIARIHNKLKDLLNICNPTLIQFLKVPKPLSSTGTSTRLRGTPRPVARTSTLASIAAKEKKKAEENEAASRPLPPLVTSRGRVVKVPSHLASGVLSSKDVFGSDESEEDSKPFVLLPQRRRRGRPRKGATVSGSYVDVKNENIAPQERLVLSESDLHSQGQAREDHPGVVAVSPLSAVASADSRNNTGDENNRNNSQDVASRNKTDSMHDPLHRPGVLRKARNISHVTAATQMRRVYEGRIKNKFFCNQCSFKSKRESHFSKHMKLHASGQMEVHSCGECDFKTLRLSHLRRHELLHKPTLLKCNICGYMTDTSQMLLKHTKLKHPNGQVAAKQQNLFRCEICGHSSSNRHYFTNHLLRHARDSNQPAISGGPGGSQCQHCQRTFQRRVHLERHLRDVHGPQLRPHLCDICGKSFKRSDALQQHKYVHTALSTRSYTYHCSKCSKGFRSQAHLREHLTRHSSERPYLCQYCGASFKTPSVQRKHILSLHLKPRSYACPQCNKQFNTSYALTRHARTHKVPEQTLDGGAGDGVTEDVLAMVEGDQPVSTISLAMEDSEAATHLQQVHARAGVVTVTDADDMPTALVSEVMAVKMEDALGEAENILQTQYMVQGNETATALFYLAGNL